MGKVRLTNKQARRIALNTQLLDGRVKLSKGKDGAAEVVEWLGYVQIDTINIINRAHNHTLWVRLQDYQPEYINELLGVDRRVFEYWGHAASYLPMADYRFSIPMMLRHRKGEINWYGERLDEIKKYLKPVLKRIEKEGPLSTKDFENPHGKREGWWDWKPAKHALELLFWQGVLMIRERRNFQRVYDLTERVLPDGVDTTCPADDELGRFLVRRALKAHGVMETKELRGHIKSREEIITLGLDGLLDSGEVAEVEVEGIPDRNYYALAAGIDGLRKLRPVKPRLHLLSPFDNIVIDRDRVRRLFGFDYTIECYVPAAKRKCGYFCLPVLWGDQLVGRLDPKADRRKRDFIINSLTLEEGFTPDDGFLDALAGKLSALAGFNKCDTVNLSGVVNKQVRAALKKRLP